MTTPRRPGWTRAALLVIAATIGLLYGGAAEAAPTPKPPDLAIQISGPGIAKAITVKQSAQPDVYDTLSSNLSFMNGRVGDVMPTVSASPGLGPKYTVTMLSDNKPGLVYDVYPQAQGGARAYRHAFGTSPAAWFYAELTIGDALTRAGVRLNNAPTIAGSIVAAVPATDPDNLHEIVRKGELAFFLAVLIALAVIVILAVAARTSRALDRRRVVPAAVTRLNEAAAEALRTAVPAPRVASPTIARTGAAPAGRPGPGRPALSPPAQPRPALPRPALSPPALPRPTLSPPAQPRPADGPAPASGVPVSGRAAVPDVPARVTGSARVVPGARPPADAVVAPAAPFLDLPPIKTPPGAPATPLGGPVTPPGGPVTPVGPEAPSSGGPVTPPGGPVGPSSGGAIAPPSGEWFAPKAGAEGPHEDEAAHADSRWFAPVHHDDEVPPTAVAEPPAFTAFGPGSVPTADTGVAESPAVSPADFGVAASPVTVPSTDPGVSPSTLPGADLDVPPSTVPAADLGVTESPSTNPSADLGVTESPSTNPSADLGVTESPEAAGAEGVGAGLAFDATEERRAFEASAAFGMAAPVPAFDTDDGSSGAESGAVTWGSGPDPDFEPGLVRDPADPTPDAATVDTPEGVVTGDVTRSVFETDAVSDPRSVDSFDVATSTDAVDVTAPGTFDAAPSAFDAATSGDTFDAAAPDAYDAATLGDRFAPLPGAFGVAVSGDAYDAGAPDAATPEDEDVDVPVAVVTETSEISTPELDESDTAIVGANETADAFATDPAAGFAESGERDVVHADTDLGGGDPRDEAEPEPTEPGVPDLADGTSEPTDLDAPSSGTAATETPGPEALEAIRPDVADTAERDVSDTVEPGYEDTADPGYASTAEPDLPDTIAQEAAKQETPAADTSVTVQPIAPKTDGLDAPDAADSDTPEAAAPHIAEAAESDTPVAIQPIAPKTDELLAPDTADSDTPEVAAPRIAEAAESGSTEGGQPIVPNADGLVAPDAADADTPRASDPTAPDPSDPTAPDPRDPTARDAGERDTPEAGETHATHAGSGTQPEINEKSDNVEPTSPPTAVTRPETPEIGDGSDDHPAGEADTQDGASNRPVE